MNRALPAVFLVICAIFAWSVGGFLGAFLVFLGYCCGIWSGLAEGKGTKHVGAGPVREQPRDVLAQLTSEQLDRVNRLLQAGRNIEAIKEVRGMTGAGLKEAKDTVDLLLAEGGTGESRR